MLRFGQEPTTCLNLLILLSLITWTRFSLEIDQDSLSFNSRVADRCRAPSCLGELPQSSMDDNCDFEVTVLNSVVKLPLQ